MGPTPDGSASPNATSTTWKTRNKWAQDVESLINLVPAYQMNPDKVRPIIRNIADGGKQLAHARRGLPSWAASRGIQGKTRPDAIQDFRT